MVVSGVGEALVQCVSKLWGGFVNSVDLLLLVKEFETVLHLVGNEPIVPPLECSIPTFQPDDFPSLLFKGYSPLDISISLSPL